MPSPASRRKIPLSTLRSRYVFPHPSTGKGHEGIVGVGAELEPGTVLSAYHQGIFPWPSLELGVVLWCSPDPRAVFPLDAAPRWSRSLTRSLRKKPFRVTLDQAFMDVVAGCGERREGTWIIPELVSCYEKLHAMGWAHSLEVWNTESGALVGGIYGIALGACFTAESMFHRETDASKVAFASLVEILRPTFRIFDGEIMSPHLASLGCVDIPRGEFLKDLADAVRAPVDFPSRP
jgi:leucyl/phenylalanyl-tRNA---protein transferase